MKRIIVALGALAIALALFISPPQQTLASWTDNEYGTGSATAGVLNPPQSLTCGGGGLLQSITYSWAAPTVTSTSITPTGYHWSLVTKTLLGPASSGDVTGTSVSIPALGLLGAGTSTFQVISTGPGGWTSATGPTGTYSVTSVLFVGLVTGCSVP